jgi:hypothetical protein
MLPHDRDLSGQHPPGQADQAVDVEVGWDLDQFKGRFREFVQGVQGLQALQTDRDETQSAHRGDQDILGAELPDDERRLLGMQFFKKLGEVVGPDLGPGHHLLRAVFPETEQRLTPGVFPNQVVHVALGDAFEGVRNGRMVDGLEAFDLALEAFGEGRVPVGLEELAEQNQAPGLYFGSCEYTVPGL